MCRRFLGLLLFLGLSVLSLKAQWIEEDIPNRHLIVNDSNQLYFPAGNKSFCEFYAKLDTLLQEGDGHLNIMHIGGSHVQAGTFSHQMRMRLLQTAPGLNANRGFIFPFSVAKTNNPYNYQVRYSGTWNWCKNTQRNVPFMMGLSGMVVCAATPDCEIRIRLRNNDIYSDFKKVRLFAYSDSNRVVPLIRTAGRLYAGSFDAESCSYLFTLEDFSDSLQLLFVRKDSVWEPFYIRGLLLDDDAPGITYHAVGVNGASVPSYLQCPLFENDLQFVKPDLCIFGIGINDANTDSFDSTEFRKHYEMLISKILQVSPNCKFLFITNNDSYRHLGRRRSSLNRNGPLVQQTFYRLANEYQGAVWDLFAVMGGLGSVRKWENSKLMQRDKVHFTVVGYKYIGDLLYTAIMDSYANYLKGEE